MSYRQFFPLVLALRLPWLAGALGAGMLAATSIARVGHVLGVAGILVTGFVLVALWIFRRRSDPRRKTPVTNGF